jgi:hypothetical protein
MGIQTAWNTNQQAKGAGEMSDMLTETSASFDTPESDRLVSMQEAMDYLSEKGFPCKSRSTFYRIIEEFSIPHINTNPSGKNAIRRFAQSALDRFLHEKGLL